MWTYHSSPVKDANKKTATTTNQKISPVGGFLHISIKNDGQTELRISIDGDSVSGTKIIFIKAGEPFEESIKGEEINYSVASGTTEFRYILR